MCLVMLSSHAGRRSRPLLQPNGVSPGALVTWILPSCMLYCLALLMGPGSYIPALARQGRLLREQEGCVPDAACCCSVSSALGVGWWHIMAT